MALKNKLGITDSVELARAEERISKSKANRLFNNGAVNGFKAGSFQALTEIHKYLFDEIYDFAGKIRTVNISKGSFRFVPVIYLETALKNIEDMPQSTFDEIIEKYVEMNIAHPFREGNGRCMRLWLDLILKHELKQVIDWSCVDRNDYLSAMERSPVKDVEIKMVLKQALSDKIHDSEIYMKGIDASYYYEGYDVYKTENLGGE
jgi:cell filamentation protein